MAPFKEMILLADVKLILSGVNLIYCNLILNWFKLILNEVTLICSNHERSWFKHQNLGCDPTVYVLAIKQARKPVISPLLISLDAGGVVSLELLHIDIQRMWIISAGIRHCLYRETINTYLYVYIYVWMDGWMYGCMYVCMSVCMSVCMYVCLYVCMSVCLCIYIYVYVYVYDNMYMSMIICICLW